MKFQVSYSRKINTGNYQNMSIGHTIEFDSQDHMKCDEMFNKCVKFVEDKIDQQLHVLGVK